MSTMTDERFTPAEFRDRLGTRAWDWSLSDFAAAVGRDPDEPGTRQLFLSFQNAAVNLGRLDAQTLAAVMKEK